MWARQEEIITTEPMVGPVGLLGLIMAWQDRRARILVARAAAAAAGATRRAAALLVRLVKIGIARTERAAAAVVAAERGQER